MQTSKIDQPKRQKKNKKRPNQKEDDGRDVKRPKK